MIKPPAQQQADMLKRLARIEGQLRGLQKQIQNDVECEQILQQMTAARRALDKAFFEMLACTIEANVIGEVEGQTTAERMQTMRTLLAKYA